MIVNYLPSLINYIRFFSSLVYIKCIVNKDKLVFLCLALFFLIFNFCLSYFHFTFFWQCVFETFELRKERKMDAEEAQKQLTHYNFKEAELSDKNKLVVKKTEMCRRFRRGVSVHGRTSHFLHSSTLLPNPYRLKEDKQAWSRMDGLSEQKYFDPTKHKFYWV